MSDSPPLPRASDAWAFFLDVDGTLVEHAPRPDAVRIDPAIVRLLGQLHAQAGGALALVSGRALADVDALFSPLLLPVAGVHGFERRDSTGRLHAHAPAPQALRRAATILAEAAARYQGLLFEDKGSSIALHYRLAPQMEEYARNAAAAAAAGLGSGYELLDGKMLIEIKPTGRDKGAAIEDFAREPPFRGRLPVFIGDDRTDEHGFVVVNRLGGHSVKVGPGESVARWRLAGPAEVHRWLQAALGADPARQPRSSAT